MEDSGRMILAAREDLEVQEGHAGQEDRQLLSLLDHRADLAGQPFLVDHHVLVVQVGLEVQAVQVDQEAQAVHRLSLSQGLREVLYLQEYQEVLVALVDRVVQVAQVTHRVPVFQHLLEVLEDPSVQEDLQVLEDREDIFGKVVSEEDLAKVFHRGLEVLGCLGVLVLQGVRPFQVGQVDQGAPPGTYSSFLH